MACVAPSLDDVCCFDAPFALTGGTCTACGGDDIVIWSGTGVVNNTFYPAQAGIGTHTLTYSCPDATSDTTTITVNDCDPLTAQIKIWNCCLADQAYKALALEKKGLKHEAECMLNDNAYLRMALDYLRCYLPETEETVATWSTEMNFVVPVGTPPMAVSFYYGGVLFGEGTGMNSTDVMTQITDEINANVLINGGFTADYSGGVFTFIAPSCLEQGLPYFVGPDVDFYRITLPDSFLPVPTGVLMNATLGFVANILDGNTTMQQVIDDMNVTFFSDPIGYPEVYGSAAFIGAGAPDGYNYLVLTLSPTLGTITSWDNIEYSLAPFTIFPAEVVPFPFLENTDARLAGVCAYGTCLSDEQLLNLKEKIKNICGCPDCNSNKIADDTVTLSGGRKYPPFLRT